MTEQSNSPAGIPRFHLALPVTDLDDARRFYGEVLGCSRGRSSELWLDWNLFGHQVVTHLVDGVGTASLNPVDGQDVPVPHFGVILSIGQFKSLAERLQSKGVHFIIEPHVRFVGEIGEQWTMFTLDPSGNALEFKAFANDEQVFAH